MNIIGQKKKKKELVSVLPMHQSLNEKRLILPQSEGVVSSHEAALFERSLTSTEKTTWDHGEKFKYALERAPIPRIQKPIMKRKE